MRRLLLLAALAAMAMLVAVPVAGAQAVGQVLGCEDFATQQDAQITLDAGTGDLSLIDADGDGVACEDFDYGVSDSGGAAAPAQQPGGSITERGAETTAVNADGTCPVGFVRTNAAGNLACAEESPNTPGRIFGFGEGDLAQEPSAAPAPEMTNLPTPVASRLEASPLVLAYSSSQEDYSSDVALTRSG